MVWRSPLGAPAEAFLTQVRHHTDSGAVVAIRQFNAPTYSVVKNDSQYLVREYYGGRPIATVPIVWAAIDAGDRWVEASLDSEYEGGAA